MFSLDFTTKHNRCLASCKLRDMKFEMFSASPTSLFAFSTVFSDRATLDCPSSKGNHAPTQKFERPRAYLR